MWQAMQTTGSDSPPTPASIIFGNHFPRQFKHQNVIFGYHKIGLPTTAAINRSNYVRPDRLRRQLLQLRKCGTMCPDLDVIVSHQQANVGRFAVTFDDGFASLFDLGLGILRECGVKAVTYVVSGQLNGTNSWDQRCGDVALPLMSEAQIRIWLAEGHAIGSHTVSHPSLTQIPEAVARRELCESKEHLEQTFGVPAQHFCYPFGDWNPTVRDWVQEAGYLTAVTVEQRQVEPSDNPWSLPRWMVYTHRIPWLANLMARLQGAQKSSNLNAKN
jgi:peptidoglycan/xylan/chitin deacetylase (PgdA/CDA1 family)